MQTHEIPPIEVLRHYFRIDRHWRLERRTVAHGWRLAAKARNKAGYFTLGFQGKQFQAHRIIWTLHYGRPPEGIIDHINGCPWDNRIENLRDVTYAQNAWNAKREARNRTGYRNVEERNGQYRGKICADYELHYSPFFDDPELAELAAHEMSRKIHGEFSVTRRAA